VQRVLGLVLLEVDARQAEGGLVAHHLVDVAFQHRADCAARPMMHAVVELEVADVELGGADVVVQRVELRLVEPMVLAELGVEALQRVEVVTLIGVEQRLSEIEIAQVTLRCRRIRPRSGRRRTGGERRRQPEPEQAQ
jgi:hypothetical protein